MTSTQKARRDIREAVELLRPIDADSDVLCPTIEPPAVRRVRDLVERALSELEALK
jgi:hypothetical protein